MLTASITSSITDALTSFIGDHGVYAVFLLMFVDAIFPAFSELVMLYAGALAAGAFAGQDVVVFGREVQTGWESFLVMVLAGTIGYTLGSLFGWWIGDPRRQAARRPARALAPPFLGPHERPERWFERWGGWAVFLGRITPVVRSFISIPAGVFRHPLGPYTGLTFAGSTLWCLAFAGIGWVVGDNWESFHHTFAYVEYAIVALAVVAAAVMLLRWRSSRLDRRAEIPLVDVKAQYASLLPELKARLAEVVEAGVFILGPNVRAFEEEAAERLGVPHAIGVANGTDALVLVLQAMEIGAGDEVICPAFTFYATAEAIARTGATPVFADIDPATLNVDSADVARRITPRTKAIMPVHLFGRPAQLDELAALGPPLIEDAAQAFGAPGVASAGVASTFSFFPTKNLFCLGDGGLVVARDREARRPHTHAPFPRIARQADVRLHRDELTARRAPGGGAAALPGSPRRVERPAARSGRAYAELGLGELVRAARRRSRPRLPHVRRADTGARAHRRRPASCRDRPRRRTT